MTRALDDHTSTCVSCVYWTHDKAADGLHDIRMGDCSFMSVPAWVFKNITHRINYGMREHEGTDCWQHTKRPTANDGEVDASR